MLRMAFVTFFTLFPAISNASNWYVFYDIFTDDALYFFDKDSVVKNKGIITIWQKSVRNPEHLETDGSQATAFRYSFSCDKRTLQSLGYTSYNKEGNFINSSSNKGPVQDVVPDSIGESTLSVVCSKNFPNDKSNKHYTAVINNDIYAFTNKFYENKKNMFTDNAPSKSEWYLLFPASNGNILTMFDMNSVEQKGEEIELWALLAINPTVLKSNDPPESGYRLSLSCANRTIKTLKLSNYDKEGNFIKSSAGDGKSTAIKTGSIFDGMFATFCDKEFPKRGGVEGIYTLMLNTPSQAAKAYFDFIEAQKSDTAPK